MSSVLSDSMFRSAIGESGTCVPKAFTDTSAVWGSPTALTPGTVYELIATENCHILLHAVSGSATATTNSRPIPAWTRTYLTVNSALYMGVIRNSTSGTLYVTPLSEASYR
jgi:hypothetical protein